MEVKKHVDKGVAIIKQLGGIDEGLFTQLCNTMKERRWRRVSVRTGTK